MATDPIEQITADVADTNLTTNIQATLAHLANLPPAPDEPYLTISMDWRPAGAQPGRKPPPDDEYTKSQREHGARATGEHRRPARNEIEHELADAIESFGPRGTTYDSLKEDYRRLDAWLDEMDQAAQGVFVVACASRDIFEAFPLGLPVETSLTIAPTPALSPLAHLVDDYPIYAVLVADQRQARLVIIQRAHRRETVSVDANGYPRKQPQGGWSQRRYQDRADERVSAFARGVAEEVRKDLDKLDIGRLIVAADEPVSTALDGEFVPFVKDRIVDTIHLDVNASDQDILEATFPIMEHAEREQELNAVQKLHDMIGSRDAGVTGADDVAKALGAGQVMTLLMNDDFMTDGWADYGMPLYGAGEVPGEHPLGGDPENLVPVRLEEEMIRLAVLTDADIQMVKVLPSASMDDDDEPTRRSDAARALDQYGGVAATLRYTRDETGPM